MNEKERVKVPTPQFLMLLRESFTMQIITWLQDEAPQAAELMRAYLNLPGPNLMGQEFMRSVLLGELGTLGDEAGRQLGLRVLMVQGSLALIDWDQVEGWLRETS